MFFCKKKLTIFLFFLCGILNSNFLAGSFQTLASKSFIQKVKLLPKEVTSMAVWELLTTLELTKPFEIPNTSDVQFMPHEDGSYSLLFEVHDSDLWKDADLIEKGVGILAHELSSSSEVVNRFELLFNERGYLIALFPDLKKVARDHMRKNKWHYLDLSPYYIEISLLSTEKRDEKRKKWERYSYFWKEDQETIKNYLRSKKISLATISPLDNASEEKNPFMFVYFDPEATLSKKKIFIFELGPIDFPLSIARLKPNKNPLIFPIFPTVYSPSRWMDDDEDFYKAIYFGIPNKFKLEKKMKVYVGGPGSGIDTWLTWLKTRSTVYASGKNPLEIANTKTTAKIASFPLIAKTHDNVIDSNGEFAFPNEKFDAFIWNMPAINKDVAETTEEEENFTLSSFWDNHFYPKDLVRLLSGLDVILPERQKALLWNYFFGILDHHNVAFDIYYDFSQYSRTYLLTKKDFSFLEPTANTLEACL